MTVPLLEARGLVRSYPPRGLTGNGRPILAVDHVDLDLDRGETLAVVGESGSGKSTLARLLLALEPADAGRVRLDGVVLDVRSEARVRPLRRRMGAVFQDPGGSLNPRLKVATLIAEPLLSDGPASSGERRLRVLELLAEVGLAAEVADRFPGALSGGERQRVALARALATGPDLLVLDEPVSALDVAVGARVLALVERLRRRQGLAVLLISHDLTVVARFCSRAIVMYRGAVVERGPAAGILACPIHPYTRRLVEARPRLEPGGLPFLPPREPTTGWPAGACRFAPTCPLAGPRCRIAPALVAAAGREVACWEASAVAGGALSGGE